METTTTTTEARWSKLPAGARRDLRHWYNRRQLTAEDKQRLAELYRSGRFQAWDCPDCGERVYFGTPEEGSQLSGRNADYTSYPGRPEKYSEAHIRRQCDCCRFWDK
jgi:hypothetical protein